MKFIKPFSGATGGSAYPTEFKVGDDCPDDLVKAATAAGAVEALKTKTKADKE